MSKYPVGGASPALEARIQALEARLNALESTHGDSNNYGTVKLSNATDVTNSAGLAIPTSELNELTKNTFANKMKTLIGIGGFHGVYANKDYSNIDDCNDLPIGYCAYTYPDTKNKPSTDGRWYVFCFGIDLNYKFQIAVREESMSFRYYINKTWYNWVNVSTN